MANTHILILGAILPILLQLGCSRQQPEVQARDEGPIPVLVTKQDIPKLTLLRDQKWFEIKMMPRGSVPKDVIGDFEMINWRGFKHDLAAGKPVTASDLQPKGEGGYLRVWPGERAMSIKLMPQQGDMSLITPGARVDVQVLRWPDDEGPATVETIVQDVEVLAVDDQCEVPRGNLTARVHYERATLRVTHETAQRLNVFADSGMLQLVLPSVGQSIRTLGRQGNYSLGELRAN